MLMLALAIIAFVLSLGAGILTYWGNMMSDSVDTGVHYDVVWIGFAMSLLLGIIWWLGV